VGKSTIDELIHRGYELIIFDVKTPKNRKLAKQYGNSRILWGDLRNIRDVESAVSGVDIVIHLAAIIPPLADHKPKLAEAVNVGGTENIIRAMTSRNPVPKLIYTSSIAIYGDRVENPYIRISDPPNPTRRDVYAHQKLKAEEIVRNSGIQWAVLRLSYIVSRNKLEMDPIMFELPIKTSIEICDTRDVGFAIANAVENKEIWGKILNIAGGETCRIQYGDYIDRMLSLFGLGGKFLPESAFSREGLHCGYMDTEESEKLLKYQKHSLEDYLWEVGKKCTVTRFFSKFVKGIVKSYMLRKSPYYCEYRKKLKPVHA
jgi:nucleoside-diphosphate-sugar epimerase